MSPSRKPSGNDTDPASSNRSPDPQAAAERQAHAAQGQLSAADMARVEKYLDSPVHRVERKPFRPWLMMLLLLVVMATLSLASVLISWWVL